jgi:ParB-like chromosome segregation protein Spo0J
MGLLESLKDHINTLPLNEKIEYINNIKLLLHDISPFNEEPVDCVIWIKNDTIYANEYNPNKVAPPEMKLLEHSVLKDGYTQPIVVYGNNNFYEVVDGFHRSRVGKECDNIKNRVHGYLPVTIIKSSNEDKNDRMASTIRHNRARGKHQVDLMSDIILDLSRRNWSNEKIAKELGMCPDEVLRLKQITGLAELFSDEEFSTAWEGEMYERKPSISKSEQLSISDSD